MLAGIDTGEMSKRSGPGYFVGLYVTKILSLQL